jgi:hypothetical protein
MMEKDTVLGFLFFGAVVGAITFCTWTGHQSSVRAKQAQEKQRQEIEDEFDQWCAVNDTIPAFKDLPKSSLLTIDLQRSLFVKKKRVAFKAQLSDVWRSEKHGTMMAYFPVHYGSAEIGVYLKCTDAQAQELYNDYQKDKDATLLIAAVFEEVEPKEAQSNSNSNSDSDSDSDYKREYIATGTLISCEIAKKVPKVKTSAVRDDD